MLYWNKYNGTGHVPNIRGKRKTYDTNIYTFDIETSSYFDVSEKPMLVEGYHKEQYKYDENDNEPEMIEDADRLVALTSRLYQLIANEMPEEATNNALFNGLVSKA